MKRERKYCIFLPKWWVKPFEKIGYSDFVKTISLKPGEECLHQVHHWISFLSRRKMKRQKFFNFLTETMAQPFTKFQYGDFVFIFIHPQYYHTSFKSFFFYNKGRQTNFLLLTKIICKPLYNKPIMATF